MNNCIIANELNKNIKDLVKNFKEIRRKNDDNRKKKKEDWY